MPKNKRIVAVITCIAIVFTLFFSMLFIVAASSHDCTGEQCPICDEIQICQKTLKSVSTAAFGLAVVASFVFSLLKLALSALDCRRYLTPISLKVKLTN